MIRVGDVKNDRIFNSTSNVGFIRRGIKVNVCLHLSIKTEGICSTATLSTQLQLVFS